MIIPTLELSPHTTEVLDYVNRVKTDVHQMPKRLEAAQGEPHTPAS